MTPHVAQNEQGRRSAIDGRTTRHPGYRRSQRRRKRVEEVFGWIKTVGAGGKLRYLGRARNRLWLELTAAAYNLTRPHQHRGGRRITEQRRRGLRRRNRGPDPALSLTGPVHDLCSACDHSSATASFGTC